MDALQAKSRKGTTMSSLSSLTHPIAVSAPFARSVAIAALMGAHDARQPVDRGSRRYRH